MAGDSRPTDPSDPAQEPERSDAEAETGAESAVPDHPRRAGRAAHAAAERARAAAESIHQAISPDPVDEVGTEWLEAALADTAAITLPSAAEPDAAAAADAPTEALSLPAAAPVAAPDDAPTEAISLEELGQLGRESDSAATAARADSASGSEPLSLADIVAAVAAAQASANAAIEAPDEDGPAVPALDAAPVAPALDAAPVAPALEGVAPEPAIEAATPAPVVPDAAAPTDPTVAAPAEPAIAAAPAEDATGHPADPRVALTLPPEMRRELLTPIAAEPAADSSESAAPAAAIDPDSEEALARAAAGLAPLPPELSLGLDSVPDEAPAADETQVLDLSAIAEAETPAVSPIAEPESEPEPAAEPAVSTETQAFDTAAFHAALDHPVDAEPAIAAEPAPAPEPVAEPVAEHTQAFDTAAFHAAADAQSTRDAQNARDTVADAPGRVFTDPTPSAAIDLPMLPAMAAAGSLSDTAAIDLARDAAQPSSGDSGGPTDTPPLRGIAGWSFGKRLGLAFTVGAIIALVLIGTQIPRLFGIGEVAEPAATVTETPPPAAEQTVAWNKLAAGSCLTGFESAWDEKFTVVDCGDDHTAQLVFVAPIGDDPDAAFPGEAELAARSALVCSAPEAYSRPAADGLATLQIQASYPVTQKEWDGGQRSYSCFASLSDGAVIPGSLVFGTE